MKPEILMIESDHDMRNPADFLVLDKLAKGIFRVPGISRVQAITRPDGTAMDHTSIPFQISMQNAGQVQTMKYQRDRMNDMLKQAEEMAEDDRAMRRMYGLMRSSPALPTGWIGDTQEMQAITNDLRDHIANFEDFFRPIRNYFYWEKHCFDIPGLLALRSIFDSLDGVDEITEKLNTLVGDIDQAGRAHAPDDREVPADDRVHGQHADDDADHAQHHVRASSTRWTR